MSDLLIAQQRQKQDEIKKQHNEQLIKSLNEMRKEGVGCDCTITIPINCGSVSSQVHYAVVSAQSKYCRNSKVCWNGRWIVTVHSRYQSWNNSEIVKAALDQCTGFVYNGEADIREDTAEYITMISHVLQLEPLEDMGLEAMNDNLTTWQNCRSLLLAARDCGRREYEAEAIKKWISLNLQQIPDSEECTTEDNWRSAANLFQVSAEFRLECEVLDVLKAIKIEKADCNFLLNVVLKDPRISKNYEAKKYVFQSISQKMAGDPSNLTTENYFRVNDLCEKYSPNDTTGLRARLQKFMINNFAALAQQPEFFKIDMSKLTTILSSAELPCTEYTKFESTVKWVECHPQQAKSFPKLFKFIKLQNLSEEELITIGEILLAKKHPALVSPVFKELKNKKKNLPEDPDTARWVIAQRPECDISSNASQRGGRSTSSNGLCSFCTASLREDQASSVTSSDSGAEIVVEKEAIGLNQTEHVHSSPTQPKEVK